MLHDRTRTVKADRRMVILTDGCSRIGSAEGLDAVVGGVRKSRASERASNGWLKDGRRTPTVLASPQP